MAASCAAILDGVAPNRSVNTSAPLVSVKWSNSARAISSHWPISCAGVMSSAPMRAGSAPERWARHAASALASGACAMMNIAAIFRSRSSSLKKRQILSAVNVARAFLGEIAFRELKTDAVQATEKCASGRSPDNADVIDRSVYRARRALFHCIRHHPLVQGALPGSPAGRSWLEPDQI